MSWRLSQPFRSMTHVHLAFSIFLYLADLQASRQSGRAVCAGFTVAFRLHAPIPVYVVLAVMWLGAATTLYTLPVVWRPAKFAVPLSPLTPALGMFITLHLIGDYCTACFTDYSTI